MSDFKGILLNLSLKKKKKKGIYLIIIQYYGNVETGMLPRSPRLFRTRGGRFHFRSRAVLQKNPGNFGEMVSPKPAIFREFLGFWSLCLFEISRKFQRRGEMMNEEEKCKRKRRCQI